MRDFAAADPRDVKMSIEGSKDDLVKDSCSWVIQDSAFVKWWSRDDTYLLNIHGEPGKGKTMMMMALIAEVSRRIKSNPGSGVLSYFFCQSADSRLNNAVAVLRGLAYHFAVQDDDLKDLLVEKYNDSGRSMFDGRDILQALSRILVDLSEKSSCSKVYFLIDALDECDIELPALLNALKKVSRETGFQKVKWLLSSRPSGIIREELACLSQPDISLKQNSGHVSKDVDTFIQGKVEKLAVTKRYDLQLKDAVTRHLSPNAGGTFLWAALVCKELDESNRGG